MKKNKGYVSEAPLSDFFMEKMLLPFLENYRSERTRNAYRQQILTVCTFFYHERGNRYSFEQLDDTDAGYYFHTYLPQMCEQGQLTLYTCRLRLSVCKSFSRFLEELLPKLQEEGRITMRRAYESPFKNLYFQGVEAVRTADILSDKDIDELLSRLEQYDRRLFIIALLSFRMMLTQEVILSLKKEYFLFIEEHGRRIGILSYVWRDKEVRKRIPADIMPDVSDYVLGCGSGPIFLNMRGNAMTPPNLTDLINKYAREKGNPFKLSQLRKKGLIDLVAHNPEALDDVGLYTGLSKDMIEEYGKAFDRICPDCIADRSSYKILSKEERK